MILRWASLQVSAHILQNLLLWWNLSATLRGCAFFLSFRFPALPGRQRFGRALIMLFAGLCTPHVHRRAAGQFKANSPASHEVF